MFAHKDIAFEFASWISSEFKLYLITAFQRLKKQESHSIKWTVKESYQNLIITFIQMPLRVILFHMLMNGI